MTDIANTILDQLGGNRFTFMTGAKALVTLHNGLRMTIPTTRRINRLQITLNQRDLYDIEVGQYKPKKLLYVVLDRVEDVSVEQLRDTIERLTGLAVSL